MATVARKRAAADASAPAAKVLPKLMATPTTVAKAASDRVPLFVSDTVDVWPQKQLHADNNGMVVKRGLVGTWDSHQVAIDDAVERIGRGLVEEVDRSSKLSLEAGVKAAVARMLHAAALPTPLSEQIGRDAESIGIAVGTMCDASAQLEIKLEIFGESICSKWHVDNFVGRALVSYTGAVGTDYTPESNVNFWEMKHCGNNDCIILDKDRIEHIDVGDILFIKGYGYKGGAGPLVHKSPTPRRHEDGRVVNRLILKVDVDTAW